jgi:hypothetical protein
MSFFIVRLVRPFVRLALYIRADYLIEKDAAWMRLYTHRWPTAADRLRKRIAERAEEAKYAGESFGYR